MSLTAAQMEWFAARGLSLADAAEFVRLGAVEGAESSADRTAKDDKVWVYVMAIDHDPEQDLIKVGVSNNPGYRRACLEKERGLNLYVAQTAGPYTRAGAMDIERKAHAVLAEHREQGEWFLCGKDRAMEVVRGLAEGALQ